MDHYFTEQPTSSQETTTFTAQLRGRTYRFTTDRGVFSKGEIDRGTLLLIGAVQVGPEDRVLDWGAGYGPITLALASEVREVWAVEKNQRAAALASQNLRENGLENVRVLVGDGYAPVADEHFDLIVSNPPFRAGKELVHHVVEAAPQHLNPGGRLVLVVQRKQGAESLAKKMEDVFGKVEVLDRSGGYRVLQSEKV